MAEAVIVPVAPGTLAVSDAILYGPVPAGFTGVVKEILLAHRGLLAQQIHLCRRTAGAVDYDIRVKASTNLLGPSDTEIWHMDLFLDEGEYLRGSATTPSEIDFHISVIEAAKTT